LLLGIPYAKSQDSICLTDKEYNDLLVKGNCSEIITADSILLDDRANTISLLYESVMYKDRLYKDDQLLLAATEKQLKTEIKGKNRVKLFAGIIIVLEAVGIGWTAARH